MSDTHGKVEKVGTAGGWTVPDGDILIHCGDFTMTGHPAAVREFDRFLGTLPHPVKVVIAGNHELTFDDSADHPFLLLRREEIRHQLALPSSATQQQVAQHCKALLRHAVYLQDQSLTVCGIRIYGSPWVPRYAWGCVGFTAERGQSMLDKWTLIPDGTDILVTHGPPCGYGDTLEGGEMRAGCTELLDTVVRRVKPRLHVFGHIHSGYGMWTNGRTTFINAAICNNHYSPVRAPIVYDIPLPPGFSRQQLCPVPSPPPLQEPQNTTAGTAGCVSALAVSPGTPGTSGTPLQALQAVSVPSLSLQEPQEPQEHHRRHCRLC